MTTTQDRHVNGSSFVPAGFERIPLHHLTHLMDVYVLDGTLDSPSIVGPFSVVDPRTGRVRKGYDTNSDFFIPSSATLLVKQVPKVFVRESASGALLEAVSDTPVMVCVVRAETDQPCNQHQRERCAETGQGERQQVVHAGLMAARSGNGRQTTRCHAHNRTARRRP